MYRLFLILKDHEEPLTDEEVAIASGNKTLDPTKAAEYLVKLEKASATIVDAFAKQNRQAAVHTHCSLFGDLLTKYFRILIGIRKHLSGSLLNGW